MPGKVSCGAVSIGRVLSLSDIKRVQRVGAGVRFVLKAATKTVKKIVG